MNNSSERTLPGWIADVSNPKNTMDRSNYAAEGSLRAIKKEQDAALRLRLLVALSFAAALHLLMFFGFNKKPAKVVAAEAPAKFAVELFKIPIEEPEVTPEEAVETTQDMHALDVAPPSLPELLSIPVDTDFVVPPLPPAPETLGPKVTQFVIPQSAGRSTAPAGQKIFNLSELDKVPQVLQSFSPTYPLELMRSHVAGLVVVQFIVDSQGDVQDVKVVSSPHQLLGLAVKRAVGRWRFRAGMKGGRAVNTTMELPVEFKPEDI